MKNKRIQFKAESVDEQGVFTGYASVFNVVDLDGDVMEPGAFAETLATGTASEGVLIFAQHEDEKEPIGRSLELREDATGLYVKGQISDTALGRDYRALIRDNVLDQMSVGYVAQDYTIDRDNIRHLQAVDLLEISIVNYPACTEARIQSYKGGKKPMSTETKKGKKPDTKARKSETKEAGSLTEDELQELLEDAAETGAQRALDAILPDDEDDDPDGEEKREQGDQTEESKNEDDDDDEDEEDKSDEEKGRKSAKPAKSVKSRRDPRAAVRRKYANVFINTGATPKEEKSGLPKGIGWVRYQKCMMRGGQDFDRAAHIARKQYGDAFMEKQIKAASVTSPTDGGYLVPEVYASEIIPLLYNQAIVLKLGATELPMEAGNLNIPKMMSGASASYVGELRKAKASKASFGNLRLSSKKLMCKMVISNDLIRSSTHAADQQILNDAVLQMALAMDRAALMGKGSAFEPKGLLNMDGIPTVNIAGAVDEATTGKMLGTLIKNNANINSLGWAINGASWEAFYNVVQAKNGLYLYREQMDNWKLNGHPYAISNQLGNSIILGDWSEFIVGRQGVMQAEMFREGTVIDETGQPVSAVDQDSTILRIIDLHDFGVRHEESFVIGENVKSA